MNAWTKADYDLLRELTFAEDYPHRPKDEIPNGDGKVDAGKRYRHVAVKYLKAYADVPGASGRIAILNHYLCEAHLLALEVAAAFGLPREAWPKLSECALRVLEYPAGVGGHRHTDFDLFTLSLYRSDPGALRIERPELLPNSVTDLNPGCHRGELLEELQVANADPHSVLPCAEPQQSIVYFALPSPELKLPSGQLVGRPDLPGTWLAERYARSRA